MNRIIGLVLALVVGGLLVGGLLIPSIEGMTATEKTFDNTLNSLAYYEKISNDDEITIFWDHTAPTEISINGEVLTLPDVSAYPNGVSLVVTEGLALRYYVQSGGRYYVQSIGGDTTAGALGYASSQGQVDLTITLSGGVWTYNANTYTLTGTTYIITDTGDYVMKNPNKGAYLLENSETAALGVTVISGTWVIMGWDSNTGADISPIEYYPPDGYIISDIVVNSEEITAYRGLSKLDNIQFKAVKSDDSTITSDVTYSYFIVPAKVTAELTNHMDATEIAMFGVISILGIVALVVVAANGIRNKY